MKVLAIVQARMSSTRLPGKVLVNLVGKPLLWHIVNRLKFSKLINKIVIATSTNEKDDAIVKFCEKYNIDFYRGSEDNLAERLYMASLTFGADISIRVWGDCPLVDPFLIDKGIKMFIKQKVDYLSNFFPEKSYPYGLDFEIYSINLLTYIHSNTKDEFYTEFPFEFVWENRNRFNMINLKNKEDLSKTAIFTIDYAQDVRNFQLIYNEFYKENHIFTFQDVLKFMNKNTDLLKVNSNLPRNIEYNKEKCKRNPYKITVLMTEENIHGREIILRLLENDISIHSVIIERGSKFAESCKSYLKNDFYNPPPLHSLLKDRNMPIYFVSDHNNSVCENIFKHIIPDIIILGGTKILKKKIFNKAKIGTINAHPGLLPQYRGMDVVAWQIYKHDTVGATCHFVTEDADAGQILMKRKLQYKKGDSLLEIRVKNMKLCAELIVETITNIENIVPQPQDESLVTRYPEMSEENLKVVENILRNEI